MKASLRSIFLLAGIGLVAILALYEYSQQTALQKKKSIDTLSSSKVTLALEPSEYHFALNERQTYTLKATFDQSLAGQTIDGIQTAVSFSPEYLMIPGNTYVDTSQSGFGEIFRVDNPSVANENGRVIIELGASTPGSGPRTDRSISIAFITFEAKATTSASQQIVIGKSQVVNDKAQLIPVDRQMASYTVGGH